MPVSKPNIQYKDKLPDWIRCRDAYNGQRAIKAAGTAYLPKLTAQSNEDYCAYKDRALFYSITSKTLNALVGMALGKEPIIKYAPEFKWMFEEQSGLQFYELLSMVLSENMLMGRFGVLLDRAETNDPVRPVPYKTEQIINWRVNDQGEPNLIVLKESTFDHTPTDEYEMVETCRYRVLRLTNDVYNVALYNEKGETISAPITPTNRGKTMDYIPFYIVHPNGIGFELAKPPMLDIVDINISHYQTSADLEHGRHFTGLPTPVVSGVPAETKLHIGSMTAWCLPDHQAKAYYLEFKGEGLASMENALKEKQAQLASLSARLIDNSTRGSEAAETVRLRYLSETSSLSAIVRACEAMLNKLFGTMSKMEEVDASQTHVELDKNFLNSKLSAPEIKALTVAFVEGAISEETLIYNLRRGDQLSPYRKDSEELQSLRQARAAREQADAVREREKQ